MYVQPAPLDQADGEVRAIYDDLRDDGYVSNMTQLFSLNPGAYRAWAQLAGAIRGQMDFRRYELDHAWTRAGVRPTLTVER